MNRICEICCTDNKETLHKQNFVVPGAGIMNYDVVMCKECGFIFADNIPSKEEYAIYYKNSNKYTYNAHIPDGLKKIYSLFYREITYVMKNKIRLDKEHIRILDIGCSIGYLLNMFKRDGYAHLDGIEPSVECKALAKKEFDLDIFSGILSEFKCDFKYNIIIISGVLEHITGLKEFLSDIEKFLADDGILVIAVPDLNKFSKKPVAPYDEFSIEHINFFSNCTLNNLLVKEGFKPVRLKSVNAEIYDNGSIINFYKHSKVNTDFKFSSCKDDHVKINQYIRASKLKLKAFEKKIQRLIEAKQKLIVWGVGSLTYRLLSNSNLKEVDIVAFVDSNKNIQDKEIMGIKIESPDILKEYRNFPVFIASNVYKKEIYRLLVEKYAIRKNVITI